MLNYKKYYLNIATSSIFPIYQDSHFLQHYKINKNNTPYGKTCLVSGHIIDTVQNYKLLFIRKPGVELLYDGLDLSVIPYKEYSRICRITLALVGF